MLSIRRVKVLKVACLSLMKFNAPLRRDEGRKKGIENERVIKKNKKLQFFT